MATNSLFSRLKSFGRKKQMQARRGAVRGYLGSRTPPKPRSSALQSAKRTRRSTAYASPEAMKQYNRPSPFVEAESTKTGSSFGQGLGGGGGGGYSAEFEASLARQRAALEDDFRRAIADVSRREQGGLQLAGQQGGLIQQQGAQTAQQLQDFANQTVAAQQASGLAPLPGAATGQMNPFLSALQVAQQGSSAEAAMLPLGVTELANRQRGGLELAKSQALQAIQAAEAERAARLEAMAMEHAMNREMAQMEQSARYSDPLEREHQELQNEALRRELNPPARTFSRGEISAERGRALQRDYSGTLAYRRIKNSALKYIRESGGDPTVFIPLILRHRYAMKYPVIASQVLRELEAAAGGSAGQ